MEPEGARPVSRLNLDDRKIGKMKADSVADRIRVSKKYPGFST